MTSRKWVADIGGAVALAAVIGTGTAFGLDDLSPGDRPVDARAVGLAVAAGLSLALARRGPLLTLAMCTALSAAYLLLSFPYGPILVALFLSVYAAALRLPVTASGGASGAALAVLLTHTVTHPSALVGWLSLMAAAAWVVVPFALGTTHRLTRESAQRSRDQLRRDAVMAERLRIAHEVHDVVGHGLAAIRMRADIGLHLHDDPQHTAATLRAISATAADALAEVRSTLQVATRDEPRAPTPGLALLDELCRRSRDHGLHVDVDVTGAPAPIPPTVDLAAYRVIQESLTNAARHGRRPVARVRLHYGTDALRLEVTNPGAAGRPAPGGLGLEGMRHRVVDLGGRFAAGPVPEGFAVSATFPVGGRS